MQLLRTSRWIGFTTLVIVAILGFGVLSYWQWTRAEDKRLQRETLAATAATEPIALSDVTQAWQPVAFRGTFDERTVQIVRQRPMQGQNGFWVLTLMDLDNGQRVWVNRGWIPAGMSARDLPDIPPAPGGQVRVTGYWVPDERAVPVLPDLPAGMIAGVSSEVLPTGATVPGFVHAQEPREQNMLAIPMPTINEGQNLSYALQWLAFACVASVGWWVMLRREARDQSN
jgi:cytochrome oxidase assembly protein ShyY1